MDARQNYCNAHTRMIGGVPFYLTGRLGAHPPAECCDGVESRWAGTVGEYQVVVSEFCGLYSADFRSPAGVFLWSWEDAEGVGPISEGIKELLNG